MFTGLIEELGRVRSLEKRGEGARLTIEARAVMVGTQEGDSIAVNGVCLTAIDLNVDSFSADGSSETLQRSTLGRLRAGAVVNLERAVTPSTRLGGHIVQGHVDARGRFLAATEHGGSWTVRIAYPAEMARYLVFKGSVSVEGISLTVAGLAEDYFEIAVIPKTWAQTNLSHLKPGDEVNLEADIIAKYVERLMSVSAEDKGREPSSLTREKLTKLGFI
jgi:riboflavin synthase